MVGFYLVIHQLQFPDTVMENVFSKIRTNKSRLDLLEYIENKEKYQEEAILAAIWELEKRDGIDAEIEPLIKEIEESIHQRVKASEKQQQVEFKIPKDLPERIKIAAYWIYLSVLLSPVSIIILNLSSTLSNLLDLKTLLAISSVSYTH